jgi:hypothetical protein
MLGGDWPNIPLLEVPLSWMFSNQWVLSAITLSPDFVFDLNTFGLANLTCDRVNLYW